jgi:hypothetical protein
MKFRTFCIAAAFFLAVPPAFSATDCIDAHQAKWIPQVEMLQRLVDAGYTIERFEITAGRCYRFRGYDKDGQKLEIDFSPVDGRAVKVWSA